MKLSPAISFLLLATAPSLAAAQVDSIPSLGGYTVGSVVPAGLAFLSCKEAPGPQRGPGREVGDRQCHAPGSLTVTVRHDTVILVEKPLAVPGGSSPERVWQAAVDLAVTHLGTAPRDTATLQQESWLIMRDALWYADTDRRYLARLVVTIAEHSKSPMAALSIASCTLTRDNCANPRDH